MANPVKQARDLARQLAKARRQAKGIRPAAQAQSAKATADEIAKEITPELLARGLIE